MCASASVSLSAGPRLSGAFCRIDDGRVSPISALRLFAPTVSSIADMSRGEGPMWRRTKVAAASLAGFVWGGLRGFFSFLLPPQAGVHEKMTSGLEKQALPR